MRNCDKYNTRSNNVKSQLKYKGAVSGVQYNTRSNNVKSQQQIKNAPQFGKYNTRSNNVKSQLQKELKNFDFSNITHVQITSNHNSSPR